MFRRRPSLPPFPPGAWLVGGAARDWLRGVPPHDYDWAVPDPQAAAEALAQQVGGAAFALDPERAYWRVTWPGGVQHDPVQHDFVPLPADLESDLRRRDFTVNALAVGEKGQVIDPVGGRRDLKARRLRMVSEANLRADPLRAWRGVRFELTLGFGLEPDTWAAIGRVAADLRTGALPMPAAERLRDELQLVLGQDRAVWGLQRLDAAGLLALSLPELLEGRGVVQGGFHHLDVYGHNLEALHQLIARQPEAPLPLRWAALLHDVGKPRSQGVNPETGRTTFYGHDKLGAEMTRDMLTRLKLPGDEVRFASGLVAAHMLPLPASDQEARRFVHRRRDLLPELLSLMLADREAARGPHSTHQSRHAYALGMERVLAALEDQPTPPPALLSGGEIMALLDLPPGPAVGAAVRALAEATALGEVIDAAQARVFLQNWAGTLPGE